MNNPLYHSRLVWMREYQTSRLRELGQTPELLMEAIVDVVDKALRVENKLRKRMPAHEAAEMTRESLLPTDQPPENPLLEMTDAEFEEIDRAVSKEEALMFAPRTT